MQDIIKLGILAIVAIAPMLILAHELSEDEFVKCGAAIALMAAAALGMKLFEKQWTKRKNGK